MPYKSDRLAINNKKLDKRVKLTEQERIEIHENRHGLSQRALARAYGVSRRLIQFILDPQKKVRDLELREKRGGSAQYYKKEKHREYMKKYRRRKHELYKQGIIGNSDEIKEKD